MRTAICLAIFVWIGSQNINSIINMKDMFFWTIFWTTFATSSLVFCILQDLKEITK
jgi:hypothetical protein